MTELRAACSASGSSGAGDGGAAEHVVGEVGLGVEFGQEPQSLLAEGGG